MDNDTKVKKVQRFVGAKFADKIITLTQEDRRNYIRKYKQNGPTAFIIGKKIIDFFVKGDNYEII